MYVGELLVEDIIGILCGFKDCYEVYYGVCIIDLVLVVVVILSDWYIIVCFLFDKVIDLVDEVVSWLWMEIDLWFVEIDEVEWLVCWLEIEEMVLFKEEDEVLVEWLVKLCFELVD